MPARMSGEQAFNSLLCECGGVVCEEQRLREIEDGQVMVSVDRPDIQRIALKKGLVAPHPVLQSGMGLLLLLPGYFVIAHLVNWARHGGTFFTAEAFVAPLVAAGIWMLITAFRRGMFLEVDATGARKRFVFRRGTGAAEIERFAATIEHHYRLRVSRENWKAW